MRALKWLGGILALYVLFVVIFEAGYLGYTQPSFEEQGIPMMVLSITDEEGTTHDRMLARFETDEHLYASAHHWPRSWYQLALDHPNVEVAIDGEAAPYRAVAVTGEEFEFVSETYPLPFMVRFLMGFPPEREILRLDPVPSV